MSFLRSRNIERVFLLSLGAVLLYMFVHLFAVLKQKHFDEVPKRMAEGSMMNLNAEKPAENLAALLQRGFYFEDPRDIELIRTVAAQGFNGRNEMDNIGELNKRAFEVSTDDAFLRGGESFRKRARLSRTLIGFTGADSLRFDQERTAPPQLPSAANVGLGQRSISGKVKDGEGPAAGVLVRLQMILPQDSLYSDDVEDEGRTVVDSSATMVKTFRVDSNNHRQLVSLVAYARTDGKGTFSFNGLSSNKAYEAVPLKPGYQFGAAKGVQGLEEDASLVFNQAPHKLRLFSTRDFNNLRREKRSSSACPKKPQNGIGPS